MRGERFLRWPSEFGLAVVLSLQRLRYIGLMIIRVLRDRVRFIELLRKLRNGRSGILLMRRRFELRKWVLLT